MGCGRGTEAASVLLVALQRNPNSPEVLARLAWVLATHPDGKFRRGEDAMLLATRADQLTGSKNPDVLDALAAAQAEQKQFDDAAETAANAAKLARAMAMKCSLAGLDASGAVTGPPYEVREDHGDSLVLDVTR